MDVNPITFLDKPKIGEPCNGCGLCCKIQTCMNGAYAMGLVSRLGDVVKGECPALLLNSDNSFSCGIIKNPKKYIKLNGYPEAVVSKNFAHMVGAGTGCDELGNEYIDPLEESKLDLIVETTKNNPNWLHKTKIALKVIHQIKL